MLNLKKISLYNLMVFCCFYQQNTFAASYHYSVDVTKDLHQVTVKLCFTDVVNQTNFTLIAPHDRAVSRISSIQFLHGNISQPYKLYDNKLSLKKVVKNDCLLYQSALVFSVGRKISGISRHNQILTDPNQWLWLPTSFSTSDAITIQFSHPQHIRVSAPWVLLNRTKMTTRYKINKRPSDWGSLVAFGDFNITQRNVKNATIRYALLNGRKKTDETKIYSWLDKNINALSTVYNQFPVDSLQILIIPLGGGEEPVPWGEVMRGGGDAVHLYIDDTRSKQEFLDDWVLSHELSHLLLPRISMPGVWLSEGLASYYQNVIRARQGLLTPTQAWQKLDAGFERGITKTTTQKNLEQVSRAMWKNRNYMRVYWSGAAISLLIDVKLRRLSSNTLSLDKALLLLHQCCSSHPKWWTALEIMRKLDALTKTSIFTEVFRENVYSTQFPDLMHVYHILGFKKQNTALIMLDKPESALRDSIMTGR